MDRSYDFEIEYREGMGFVGIDTRRERVLFTIATVDNGPDYPSEGMFRITEKGKVGFADIRGEIVVPPAFDAAMPFSGGFAAVCEGCTSISDGEYTEFRGGKWGFIDASGKMIIDPEFDTVAAGFFDGAALVEKGGEVFTIDTEGAAVTIEPVDYREWTALLGRAASLVTELRFSDKYGLKTFWRTDDGYRFYHGGDSFLRLELTSLKDGTIICVYNCIPWTDFTIPAGRADGSDLVIGDSFITVSEYCIVYQSFPPRALTKAEKEDAEAFDGELKRIINYPADHHLQEEELNIPLEAREISHEVYRYFVDLQVAVPGSRLPEYGEWKNICTDRMLHLRLVPDMGRIEELWIKTGTDPAEAFDKKKRDGEVRRIFSGALEKALADPDSLEAVQEEWGRRLSELQESTERLKERLMRWLAVDTGETITPEGPSSVFPSKDNIFGDYEPKETEDTAQDYMPGIGEELARLPPSAPENLYVMLRLFVTYKERALRDPGEWTEGNLLLGARPKEYVPSRAELLCAELGDRIRQVVGSLSPETAAGIFAKEDMGISNLEYTRFSFTHADVMGSGRFFYVENMEKINIPLITFLQQEEE